MKSSAQPCDRRRTIAAMRGDLRMHALRTSPWVGDVLLPCSIPPRSCSALPSVDREQRPYAAAPVKRRLHRGDGPSAMRRFEAPRASLGDAGGKRCTRCVAHDHSGLCGREALARSLAKMHGDTACVVNRIHGIPIQFENACPAAPCGDAGHATYAVATHPCCYQIDPFLKPFEILGARIVATRAKRCVTDGYPARTCLIETAPDHGRAAFLSIGLPGLRLDAIQTALRHVRPIRYRSPSQATLDRP